MYGKYQTNEAVFIWVHENNKQMELYSPRCMENNKQLKLYFLQCTEINKQMKLYSLGVRKLTNKWSCIPWVYGK
jgi:hypothetical protein